MMSKNSNWHSRPEVIKGNLGESIVDRFLESKGFIVYHPKTDGAHGFDRIAVRNKQQMIIAECKSKASRKFFPDTGIDQRNYKEYKLISEKHKIPLFLFFIDEFQSRIYGNFLSVLSRPYIFIKGKKKIEYPKIEKNIIYFCLDTMRHIENLTSSQSEELKRYSTRSYDY